MKWPDLKHNLAGPQTKHELAASAVSLDCACANCHPTTVGHFLRRLGAAHRKTGEEEEQGQPRPVDSIGDEAFWIGDRVAGALFVLKGDVYFRISVGGWADEDVRLGKTKALAQKVAKRL